MRKMQDYVVRGKDVFIGLEDSKKTWRLCVRSVGQVIAEASLPAEFANLQRYLERGYPECRIQVIYEAGFSGFWLHDRLEQIGVKCIVTPPHLVTEEKVNKRKNDTVDARRLAKILEGGDYQACHVPDPELRADRQLCRTISQLQKDITANKNRVRKFLDFHGLNAGFSKGKFSKADYLRLEELELPPSLRIPLQALLDLVKYLEAAKAQLLVELKAIMQKERYRQSVAIKQSAPGIGWLTSARLTLEWGDLQRFAAGIQLASFAGLTASEHSSGEKIQRGRITGQGSAAVRAWLVQSAWRALKQDPVLLRKFERVKTNSGSKKKAIVAVARKLAVRLHSLETNQQMYEIGLLR